MPYVEYVVLVTAATLLQFTYFGWQVGRARARCGVPAPATSGHPEFERYYRVHMNTLEQLVMFLPLLWIFAHFVSAIWGAAFGAVFIFGRALYARAYVRDPASRSLGFGVTFLPMLAMLITVVAWAIRSLARQLA
jgi:glutathione S-transferase